MRAFRRLVSSRFVLLLVALIVLGRLASHWLADKGGLREIVAQWGPWAPLVTLFVQSLTSMTPVGAVVISVANGALFPFWVAVGLNLAAGTLGGIGMYFVWRRGDREFDIQSAIQKMPPWFRRHAPDNLVYLTVLRFVPWAGGSLADLIAGAHRIPLYIEVLSLILGYAPGAFLYALIGAGVLR